MFTDATKPAVIAKVGECLWTLRYSDSTLTTGQVITKTTDAYLNFAAALSDDTEWTQHWVTIARAWTLWQLSKRSESSSRIETAVRRAIELGCKPKKHILLQRLCKLLLKTDAGKELLTKDVDQVLRLVDSFTLDEVRTATPLQQWYELAAALADLVGDHDRKAGYLKRSWLIHFELAERIKETIPLAAAFAIDEGFRAAQRRGVAREELEHFNAIAESVGITTKQAMAEISVTQDVTKEVQAAIELGSKYPLIEVLNTIGQLVFECGNRRYINFVEQEERNQLPFVSYRPVDAHGLPLPEPPPLRDESGDFLPDGLWYWERRHLLHVAASMVDITVVHAISAVERGDREIEDAITGIVQGSLFVPQDRASLIIKGLCFAVRGDVLIAAHLLLPQVENCLRHMARSSGATPRIYKRGRHEWMNLREAFEYLSEGGYLPEGLQRLLKAVIVDRGGVNARNDHCHGIWGPEEYADPYAKLAIWTAFTLIWVGWRLGITQSRMPSDG